MSEGNWKPAEKVWFEDGFLHARFPEKKGVLKVRAVGFRPQEVYWRNRKVPFMDLPDGLHVMLRWCNVRISQDESSEQYIVEFRN